MCVFLYTWKNPQHAVKPSVSCRKFATCKRSLNGVEVDISAILRYSIIAHSSTFRRQDRSRRDGRGGIW
jgi:hypothetical protein